MACEIGAGDAALPMQRGGKATEHRHCRGDLPMTIRSIPAALVAALLASTVAAQTPYTVQQYGPTCGPIAQGDVMPRGLNNYQFNLMLSSAASQEHVVLIMGLNETATPINFGMPCLLLTELIYTELHTTTMGGTYTWHQQIPQDFLGQARFQFATVDFCQATGRLVVRTSNGVQLAHI